MLNVFYHPYQLDKSISNFRVEGRYFSFLFKETSVSKKSGFALFTNVLQKGR